MGPGDQLAPEAGVDFHQGPAEIVAAAPFVGVPDARVFPTERVGPTVFDHVGEHPPGPGGQVLRKTQRLGFDGSGGGLVGSRESGEERTEAVPQAGALPFYSPAAGKSRGGRAGEESRGEKSGVEHGVGKAKNKGVSAGTAAGAVRSRRSTGERIRTRNQTNPMSQQSVCVVGNKWGRSGGIFGHYPYNRRVLGFLVGGGGFYFCCFFSGWLCFFVFGTAPAPVGSGAVYNIGYGLEVS